MTSPCSRWIFTPDFHFNVEAASRDKPTGNSLAYRQELSQLKCAITGRSLTDDIREGSLGDSITFRADDAALVVCNNGLAFACDGEQTADVLCTGAERAIAIEAKPRETRMGASDFRKLFCVRCEKSKHSDSRLSGSMVAVLERSLPFEGTSELVAHVDGGQWTLAEPWWLVVRQVVLNRWRRSNDLPVASARFLLFDELAEVYASGSHQKFDQLVKRVVGSDFARRWKLSLNEP